MSWREWLTKGTKSLERRDFEDALRCFDEASKREPNHFSVHDQRAIVLEKLGRTKDALQALRRSIACASHRWQPYARSARLFSQMAKPDAALVMTDHALTRLRETAAGTSIANPRAEAELTKLRAQAQKTIDEKEERELVQRTCHIGKLPFEMLTTVLDMIVEDRPSQVVRLAQVCHHWRAVCLANPDLWRTFSLSGKGTSSRKAREWMKRSKGRISELRLENIDHVDAGGPLSALEGLQWPLLRTLRADVHDGRHWSQIIENLDFRARLPLWTQLHELDLVASPSTIALSQFHFGGPVDPAVKSPMRRLSFISICPPLIELATHFVDLTHLTIMSGTSTGSYADLAAVLRANLNLVSMTLDLMNDFDFDTSTSTEPVILARLESLDLARLSKPLNMITPLKTPRLSKLSLRRITEPIDRILGLLTAGNSTGASANGPLALNELAVRSCALKDVRSVLYLLSKASGLEALEISGVGGRAPNIIDALCNGFSDVAVSTDPSSVGLEPLCPGLRHVNFSNCPDVTSTSVLSLIKTRMPAKQATTTAIDTTADVVDGVPALPAAGRRPLRRISTLIVDGCPLIDPDVRPWLRQQVKTFSCVDEAKRDSRRRR